MTEREASELLKRYKKNQCTEAESALVDEWFSQYSDPDFSDNPDITERIGNEIYKQLPTSDGDVKKISPWPLIATVAAIFALMIGTWLYFDRKDSGRVQVDQIADISPGGNSATLTLSSGKVINLDTGKAGIVINNAGVSYNDGTAVFNERNDEPSGFATITTPNGGEYQIVLSDGTKVWLNAASTLLYPTTFRERGARKVELRGGEAYFQVAKDKKHPFIVKTGQQNVLVLGTHFNINAYDIGAGIRTTLLEGSVKVNYAEKSKKIKPGEQAIQTADGILVRQADLDLEMAWKNGKIEFMDADIKSIMETLERWYNIQVIYQGKPTEIPFTGSVSRHKNISEILKLLESTGDVQFKIEGRRVEVLSK